MAPHKVSDRVYYFDLGGRLFYIKKDLVRFDFGLNEEEDEDGEIFMEHIEGTKFIYDPSYYQGNILVLNPFRNFFVPFAIFFKDYVIDKRAVEKHFAKAIWDLYPASTSRLNSQKGNIE